MEEKRSGPLGKTREARTGLRGKRREPPRFGPSAEAKVRRHYFAASATSQEACRARSGLTLGASIVGDVEPAELVST